MMRGLSNFISGLRSTETREDEQQKVQKELANIRTKLTTSANSLSDYDRKKYLWKLIYIYLLGYPVDIGHMVAIGMVGNKTTSVKIVGYIACSVLFTEKNELLRLVIQSIKADLASRNDIHQALALAFIGVVGNREFAEALSQDLQKILFSPHTRPIIRKKCVLALLRLFRKNPDVVPQEEEFDRQAVGLLEDGNIGVLTSTCSLLLALASIKTKGYESVVPRAVVILNKVVFADPRNKSVYKYYNTICPWLQVKILKLLQYFPAQCANISTESWRSTPEQAAHTQRLYHTLNQIISTTVMTKNPNKNNGDHCILFEAANLIIHMARTAQNSTIFQQQLDQATQHNPEDPLVVSHNALQDLVTKVSNIMTKFLANPEPNFRYLGLDCMVKLSFLTKAVPTLREQIGVVTATLKDPDVTLRKRSLDVLYAICDNSNVIDIVRDMMECLHVEVLGSIKQDVILKILVLSEKFHPTLQWYFDTTMELLCNSSINNTGDTGYDNDESTTGLSNASNILTTNHDIWHRVVQIVQNNEDLQQYAVLRAYKYITENNTTILPLNGIKLTTYILGEFSCKAFDDNNNSLMDPVLLFNSIQHQFKLCNNNTYTRCIILCSYVKLAFTFAEIKHHIEQVFLHCAGSLDEELQQRAVEYHRLLYSPDIDISTLEIILDVMPQYETKTELETRLNKSNKLAADRDVWTQPEPDVVTEIDYGDDDEAARYHSSMSPTTFSNAAHAAATTQDGKGYHEQPQQMLLSLRNPNIEIFKSDLLNVAVKLSCDGAQAKMIFVVLNKAQYDITNVSLVLPQNQDVLRAQCKPNVLPAIKPQQQERFLLLWQAFRPFETPPPTKITFSYVDQREYQAFIQEHQNDPQFNGAPVAKQPAVPQADNFDLLGIFNDSPSQPEPQPQEQPQSLEDAALEHATQHVSLPIRLPIFTTTFNTPNNSIDGPGFLPRWKELGNQTVAKLQTPEVQYITVPALTSLLEQQLHMAIIPGVDQSRDNLYGYATFNALRKDSADTIAVDVMVRIETKPGQPVIRVIINSGSTAVSAAVMKSIQLMLFAKVVE